MKNIHILPTQNPSRLLKTIPKGNLILSKSITSGSHWENQHIYITSDEEIKEGDWVLNISNNKIFKQDNSKYDGYTLSFYKKIILTTDPDLIKDGVQAIDDEFLEWFVKNPSCEEVEVESFCKHGDNCPSKGAYDKQYLCEVGYKIIIPKEEPKTSTKLEIARNIAAIGIGKKEEPKQETLEEAMRRNGYHDEVNDTLWREGVLFGAKWQQERMYSEEEVLKILLKQQSDYRSAVRNTSPLNWVLMLRNGLNNLKRNKL